MSFAKLEKLTRRSYITAKALSTISQVELINKKDFAKTILDENLETFVIYIVTLKTTKIAEIAIYLLQVAQQATLQ